MVNDEKKGSLKEYNNNNNNNNNNNQRGSGEVEKSGIGMETEGRGFSEMYRNSSEELFLKSIMESSVGMGVPTMEMLGFKNLSQNFRVDSEELFKTWLTNGENHGSSTSIAHRTRQASRRISNEIANQSTQQHVSIQQRKRSNDVLFTQSDATADDISTDLNQQSIRNAVEKSMQASNLYLAKAWFHSTQPMTRSRSSELRRRYAAMQNAQTSIGVEAMQNASLAEVSNLKQEFADPNGYSDVPAHDNANQIEALASPSNSSSSTFNAPQIGNVDKVSYVVNMLKGTLERRKLANQIEKETVDDSSNGFYHAQEGIVDCIFDQGRGNSSTVFQGNFQEGQIKDTLQTVQRNADLKLEGLMNLINPIHFGTISREQSQSESSAAAPVVSSGLEACDGPSNSSQTPSVCESSRKQVGNGRNSENGYRAKDFRERIMDTLKDDRKRGAIVRYGSVTSADSVDKGDPTKKRRVERSRKMAEAKERSSTPAIPSDMQAVLKRCENLEKEVRSLKLNLSFMNRKDSEQTKQIEELQKRNEDLADEKERLLEEIERILSETATM